jgi:phosphatidylglycerol:prolipoprotein diacylglycerol transferase
VFPILFHLGPFTLHTYGLFVALGFFLGITWIGRQGPQAGLPSSIGETLLGPFLLGGIGGARLFYVFFHLSDYAAHPLNVLKIWEGGLVWYGGVLGGAAAAVWVLRKKNIPLGPAADLTAPAAALGQALGRLGCFFAGCCYGRTCSLPWAVTFRRPDSLAPLNTPLHPAQLYEFILNLGLFGLLAFLFRSGVNAPAKFFQRRTFPHPPLSRLSGRGWPEGPGEGTWVGRGKLFFLYLALAGPLRLVMEAVRGDDRGALLGGLTPTQWVALGSFAVGTWGLRRRTRG